MFSRETLRCLEAEGADERDRGKSEEGRIFIRSMDDDDTLFDGDDDDSCSTRYRMRVRCGRTIIREE